MSHGQFTGRFRRSCEIVSRLTSLVVQQLSQLNSVFLFHCMSPNLINIGIRPADTYRETFVLLEVESVCTVLVYQPFFHIFFYSHWLNFNQFMLASMMSHQCCLYVIPESSQLICSGAAMHSCYHLGGGGEPSNKI